MRFITMIIFMLTCQQLATADELHLVVNGKAIHLESGEYNENNWGVGLEYDWAPKNNWNKFVHASYFKDSAYNTSKYIGGGLKRRWSLDDTEDGWRAELGAIAFLMTRKDYKDNDPFPGILPFVAVSNGPVTLNMSYIPSVDPKHKHLLYFQLLLRVATFD